MSLTAFTGTVSAATLNANFDDKTSTLTTQALEGQVDQSVNHRVVGLDSSTALALRVLDFTAPDDLEARVLRLEVTDTGTGATVTATLTESDGANITMVGGPYTISVAGINGTARDTLDCRTVTAGYRMRLVRGVRYRLTLSSTAAVTSATASLQLRSRRRVR
jgi:hypothetical protein